MAENRKPTTISGRKARQGDVVLKTPLRRAIFIGGLAGIVILGIALALA
ncbi:peptide ABC transporter permease [Chelativorans sp. AA-79]|nr:peptide ABC transporter permease [Chelativorans sp. AA-79]WEX09881.1 peptide ABC transporter permease [Chelativorans sp. AA-79]